MKAAPLLPDYLAESAARRPGHIALVCGGRRLSYAELEGGANALAHALVRRGVQRGDRVVIFGGNTPEAALAFWAALKANAVACVVNPLTRPEKLAYMLNDCAAAAALVESTLAPAFAHAAAQAPALRATLVYGTAAASFDEALDAEPRGEPPPRRSIDIDLAALVYTSGSTGEPKGVMLTHRNMLAAAESISGYLELAEDEVILSALPLAFDYGLYQMILAFRAGARVVLERSFAFPQRTLARVAAEGVTAFPGVPTMFAAMADMKCLGDYDFSRVRLVTNTAAALHERQIAFLRRCFANARIYSMYGLTECKRCSYLPPQDLERKPGSVGVAIPNTELWIAGEDGRRLGPNQVGELVVRGATVMRGYWGKPRESAERLRPGPLPGELVLYTGDYCRMDEEGYLYFVGRMDDIIKSRGEKVPPREVEDALLGVEGVKEAAVIGVPDELLGQAVKAFVVPMCGADLDEQRLRAACQRRLESFMVPKHIVVVPELPRGDTGQVRKAWLS
jgi:amino acid adenylation domain-containing protein